MRIAVVGARGQLGAAVVEECSPGHRTIGFARDDLDIADDQAVIEAMLQFRPDAIVNGIAYTDVDGAEIHPIDALNANAFAVRTLARAATATGAALVHYSTARTTGPIRAASTPRRNCSASGSPPTPRLPTCCASSRCSAAPRPAPHRAARSPTSSTH
jgi:nucleoside-diphosphate-sugar epimerase